MWHIQRWNLWCFLIVCVWGKVCMSRLFWLVLLIGCRDDKEKEPFWLKPVLLKLLYDFPEKWGVLENIGYWPIPLLLFLIIHIMTSEYLNMTILAVLTPYFILIKCIILLHFYLFEGWLEFPLEFWLWKRNWLKLVEMEELELQYLNGFETIQIHHDLTE